MPEPGVAPFGGWRSPITSALIASGVGEVLQIELDGPDVYWAEGRPAESGRVVIVRRTPDGRVTDITPPPFNARTRVHEYGGGAFVVDRGVVYFANYADQRLYRVRAADAPDAKPEAVTVEGAWRYADGIIDRNRGRMICVREDHSEPGGEAVNTLVSVPLPRDADSPLTTASSGEVLVSGYDFFSSPRLSPDGMRLTWLAWNHPNMPWDGTELWEAELTPDGMIARAVQVAGGLEESIYQPEWSPAGILHFVSDRNGWWNLYRWRHAQVEPVLEMEAEFGRPQWNFGQATYAFESGTSIIAAYTAGGIWKLGRVDSTTGQLKPFDLPYTELGRFVRAVPGTGKVVFEAGAPARPITIVELDLATGEARELRKSTGPDIDPGYLSMPQPVEFPTENGLTAHGFFYAPRNRDFVPPPGELPPLLVLSHGGPTSATRTSLTLGIQYWTSRGFAVLDVNYGGSTGYGRAYRTRLNGQWGVVDVEDCAGGARYLVRRGDVDPHRLAIRGGSAGGYTTLCAVTFSDVFKAGASHFGIGDLETFVRDTHKFESRYLDRLVGPYPERRDLYRERSAINFLDRVSCPVILFQGLEDKVVPPNQAEDMFRALRDHGLPVAYLAFEGEQHGFRRADTIQRVLDAELFFYSRVFGFALPEPIEPIRIENLP